MATIPSAPSEKNTTKVSFAQAIIDALNELNLEVAGSVGFLKNGSFEEVDSGEPTLWVVTDNAGGSHAISDATDSGGEAHHGQRSLQMTTTAGGGYVDALSDEFLPVGNGNTVLCAGFARRDTASIRIRAQVLYYNENKSLVATDDVYDNSGTGTTYALVGSNLSDAPSTAHFYKVKIIGGESGGSIGGNVFFDGMAVAVLLRPPALLPTIFSSAGATTYTVPDGVHAVHITVAGGGGGGSGRDGAVGPGGGGGSGFIEGHTVGVSPGDVLVVTVGAAGTGGAAGNDGTAGGSSWVAEPAGNFANRFVSAAGGNGGVASGGVGGTGWNNGANGSGITGGDGADHVYGTNGVGGVISGNGTDATGNCAGGGGGGNTSPAAGGDGADGYIIITPHLN